MDNLVILKGILLIISGVFILLLFSYLLYLIFKTNKKVKTGKIAGICFFTFFLSATLFIIKGFPFLFFENYFFFKEDVHKILNKSDLVLSDKFKILDNNVDGFTSSTHAFTLEISEQDEEKLIRNSNLKPTKNTVLIKLDDTEFSSTKIMLNIEEHTLYYERTY